MTPNFLPDLHKYSPLKPKSADADFLVLYSYSGSYKIETDSSDTGSSVSQSNLVPHVVRVQVNCEGEIKTVAFSEEEFTFDIFESNIYNVFDLSDNQEYNFTAWYVDDEVIFQLQILAT